MAIGWAALMTIAGITLARRPLQACIAILWVSALQNSLLPALFHLGAVDAPTARVLLVFKDLILLLTLLTLSYQAPSDLATALRRLWPATMLWGLLFLYLLLPIGPFLTARLIGLRYLGSPALLLLCGWMAARTERDLQRLLRTMIMITVVAAGFGLVERYALPITFWSDVIGEGDYLLNVKGLQPYLNVIGGLNANHFAFGLRRLVTVYGDALSAGSNLALGTMLLLSLGLKSSNTHAKHTMLAWAAVSAIATLATVSREAVLTVVGSGTVVLVLHRRHIALRTWGLLLVLALLSMGSAAVLEIGSQVRLAFETLTSLEYGSTRVHLLYLVTGAAVVSALPLGTGLGTSGFWSRSLFELSTPGVGESAYFSIATQVGWTGVVLLACMLFQVARQLNQARRTVALDGSATALLAVVCVRFILSLFSENLFAFTGSAALFVLAGATLRAASSATQDSGLGVGLPATTRA